MPDQKAARCQSDQSAPECDVDPEQPIAALNEALVPVERALITRFDAPSQPTIFIVGAPRSGTTLLVQLLISGYRIGYVSNLTARFWKAPYLGMLLADELRNETGLPAVEFSSDLGFTPGYEGPHEFGYFWRRWFAYEDTHCVSAEALKNVDVELLRQECAAMESVLGRPFLFKNLVCSFQINFLAEAFPRAVFVHCRRKPLFVAQSLLRARIRYCGKEQWFSVKPEAYPSLRDRPYPEQIAGQIFHTRRHVEQAFEALPTRRFCRVDYEALTEGPERSLRRIAELVEANGGVMEPRKHFTPPALSSTNEITVSPDEFQRLKASCRQFFGESQLV